MPIDISQFSTKHIIVVGDVMIDRYIYGKIQRISPEAPVPIVIPQHKEEKLGGAANVALNVLGLGAKVSILSVVGKDEVADIVDQLCKSHNMEDIVLIKDNSRRTTIKTRILAQNQHILRVDEEDVDDINSTIEEQLLQSFNMIIESKNVDGVILQDYNKGVFTKHVIQSILNTCKKKGIKTFIDPKEKNFFEFKGCTLFKPNKREVEKAMGMSTENIDEINKYLKERLQNEYTMITLGASGLYLSNQGRGNTFQTSPIHVVDVCGAGDSVISMAALAISCNINMEDVAYLCNLTGGLVCEYMGVIPISKSWVEDRMR